MKRRFGKAAIGSVLVIMAALALPAAAQFRDDPGRPVVQLPDGPVRGVILRNCAACHGIDDFGFNSYDRAGWKEVVDSMKTMVSGRARGSDIISLTENEETILLDWLVAELGPDYQPLPRKYIPRVLTEEDFFSESEARAILTTTCAACHTLARVEGATKTQEGWRATVLEMRGRGAQLAELDIEPLIEWLWRTRGRGN